MSSPSIYDGKTAFIFDYPTKTQKPEEELREPHSQARQTCVSHMFKTSIQTRLFEHNIALMM